jgi:hypothetical protein
MTGPATLLAKVDAAGETASKASEHALEARRQYRAALLAVFMTGEVTVTELARRRGTSWSRMGQMLDQARAEANGLATLK